MSKQAYFFIALMLLLNFPAVAGERDNNASCFLPNKGQVRDQHNQPRTDIDAKVGINGVAMFIGSGELHYQWVKSTSPGPSEGGEAALSEYDNTLSPSGRAGEGPLSIYRMDVELVGADKTVQPVFEEATGYTEHYYKEYTGEDGLHISGYNKVIYKNVYPNIDWVMYITTSPNPSKGGETALLSEYDNTLSPSGRAGEGSLLKYDFIIHPGGNPADIRLLYKGATELKLQDGALTALTPFGSITEAAPVSYIQETGAAIASAYVLKGNELSFEIAYTGSNTLVIDPTLEWATYYGDSASFPYEVITDNDSGYIYIVGRGNSANFGTTGAHQTSFSGINKNSPMDGFIVKFAPDGSRVWGTYYGGSDDENIIDIDILKNTGIVICGWSESDTAIATSGSHQPTRTGNTDGFLALFNLNGVRQWATYYGGGGEDDISGVACDDSGYIYICGSTTSSSNIATSGSQQPGYSGPNSGSYLGDGYIAKFSSTGARQWGTYYGGTDADRLYSIDVDAAGYAYICGETLSADSIATPGAHDTSRTGTVILGGQNWNGCVAKFTPGGKRVWGSYYGAIVTRPYVIEYNNGVIFFGGITTDTSDISTTGSHQPNKSSYNDAFLVKFDTSGVRQWGTYYGGTKDDFIRGIQVGGNGNIYIGGNTASTTGIATAGSVQPFYGGAQTDGFYAIFTAAGVRTYGTYVGGTQNDTREGQAYVNYTGALYFITDMASTGMATSGSFQSSIGQGGFCTFLAKYIYDTLAYIPRPFADTVLCPGDTIVLPYGVSTAFKASNTFTVQLSDATGSFSSPVAIGTRSDTTGDTIICKIPVNTPPGTGYRLRIQASSPATTSWGINTDIRIKANPDSFYNNSNTPICTGDTIKLLGNSSSAGITWAWTGPNSFSSSAEDTFIANGAMSHAGNYILKATLNSTGCSLSDTTTVVMKPTPAKPSAGSNTPVCQTLPLNLTASTTTSGVSWSWTGPASYTASTASPVRSNTALNHAGDYIVTATLNGCSSSDTETVVILPKPNMPTAAATNSPLCANQDLQLTASTVTNASYTWYGANNFSSNTQNPTRVQVSFADSGMYYVFATVSGCISDTDSIRVIVNKDPVVNIFPTPGTTICDGEEVTFTAIPTNAGTATYKWTVNHIATGSTGTVYKSTSLNNGDVVRAEMVSTGTCATPFTDTSNGINMIVQQVLQPSVQVAANPGVSLWPNQPVTFTATPTNGGASPAYQWLRNGNKVTGATGATWGANANFLNSGDDICVVLYSDYVCPEPDSALSNCLKMEIRLSVDEVEEGSRIKVYPNPVNNELHIEGVEAGTTIQLYDVVGREVLSTKCDTENYTINTIQLVSGNYLLQLTNAGGERVVYKVVKE